MVRVRYRPPLNIHVVVGMYNNIEPKANNNEINVVVEISANSGPVKYELDKDTGLLVVDRFLQVAMQYPCNYGFIPNTLSDDGDPIDVLVITDYPLIAGCVIKCKPIGLLFMEDESGKDEKIIAVPANKVDVKYAHVNDINDLSDIVKKKIKHFFERYKDLDANKWVEVSEFGNKAQALEMIHEAIRRCVSSCL